MNVLRLGQQAVFGAPGSTYLSCGSNKNNVGVCFVFPVGGKTVARKPNGIGIVEDVLLNQYRGRVVPAPATL